jgi:hypothetical protein
MKLTLPQLQTLKRLTNGPRSSISFTTAETYSPGSYHSPTHLKNLEMNGLVVEIGDLWHMTNAGRMALMEKPQHIPRISNGTTSELYVEGNWKDKIARRGALDFLKCRSLHTATPTC